ncbi:MAG: hypothetical protein A2W99_09100 [Bacteroidetes bacterium GWF2_33_16]|nr:MAG: hypothetical protein A2X00_07545 [Bacteroidetes bacterium GWE2_32_14]OFY03767.1 MAG: hypothetical protein A2W99_09100 [Bacteroidetes bacterium GWF2_33_16]
MENIITKYCLIDSTKVIVDGKTEFENSANESFGDYMKSIYRHYDFKYPKYFKMDNLCKIAFIASEIILKDNEIIKTLDPNRIGVILQNSHSTIDTDLSYVDTIKDKSNYFPSPAIFVYTLPNVMIGEICIRNKFQGENTCFVAKEFDPDFITEYVNNLMDSEKLDVCLTGWADFIDNNYKATLFLVEKIKENQKDNISFRPENLKKINKEG